MCVCIYIRDKPGNYGFSQFSLTAVIVILAHHLTVVRLLQVLAAFYNHKKKKSVGIFTRRKPHISFSLYHPASSSTQTDFYTACGTISQ